MFYGTYAVVLTRQNGEILNSFQRASLLFFLLGTPITYSINSNWQPLHEAAKGGDVRILQYLIEHGAPVNPPIVSKLTL